MRARFGAALDVRYAKKKTDDSKLVTRLREIAEERPRFGYRRVHAILRREGFDVNRKRVYRIYRAAGLKVKRRSRRQPVQGNSEGSGGARAREGVESRLEVN